jgi:hypothetical protein
VAKVEKYKKALKSSDCVDNLEDSFFECLLTTATYADYPDAFRIKGKGAAKKAIKSAEELALEEEQGQVMEDETAKQEEIASDDDLIGSQNSCDFCLKIRQFEWLTNAWMFKEYLQRNGDAVGIYHLAAINDAPHIVAAFDDVLKTLYEKYKIKNKVPSSLLTNMAFCNPREFANAITEICQHSKFQSIVFPMDSEVRESEKWHTDMEIFQSQIYGIGGRHDNFAKKGEKQTIPSHPDLVFPDPRPDDPTGPISAALYEIFTRKRTGKEAKAKTDFKPITITRNGGYTYHPLKDAGAYQVQYGDMISATYLLSYQSYGFKRSHLKNTLTDLYHFADTRIERKDPKAINEDIGRNMIDQDLFVKPYVRPQSQLLLTGASANPNLQKLLITDISSSSSSSSSSNGVVDEHHEEL